MQKRQEIGKISKDFTIFTKIRSQKIPKCLKNYVRREAWGYLNELADYEIKRGDKFPAS